ncbi:protein of unknown function [Clostridium beijerinckii]|nr:protein of unknown function [Clostridium beijerinckii]
MCYSSNFDKRLFLCENLKNVYVVKNKGRSFIVNKKNINLEKEDML